MKTLLCVDDDPWMLEMLRDALTAQGVRVLTTASAEEAPLLLSREKIDLVLLDLNMPGKNGFSLFRELMVVQELPVLFVSGCSRSFKATSNQFMELYQKEFLLGQTDILYKPFPLALLYEKVESLIGSSATA